MKVAEGALHQATAFARGRRRPLTRALGEPLDHVVEIVIGEGGLRNWGHGPPFAMGDYPGER